MKRWHLGLMVATAIVAIAGWKIRWCSSGREQREAQTVAPKPDPWASPSGNGDKELAERKMRERGSAVVAIANASVSGVVVRKSDGSAIAGAVVSLEPDQIGGDALAMFSGESKRTTAVTDDNGRWSATVTPGRYIAAAIAPEFAPQMLPAFSLGSGEKKSGVDFRLEAGQANVSGTVTDFGGGPIGGAVVSFSRAAVEDFLGGKNGSVSVITDANGKFRVSLPRGEWEGRATHDEYMADEERVEVEAVPVVADFRLSPGGAIRGRVVSRETNEPVADALVQSSAKTGRSPSVRSDERGNFVLRGVAWGAVELTANARGYRSNAPTVVELGIGEQVTGVTVYVDRAFNISGFVVRAENKDQGIRGVLVGGFSLAKQAAIVGRAPSGADGYFEILGVAPGTYMLGALGTEHMPNIGQSVTVSNADVSNVLLALETGATVTGKVTPPQAARVTISLDKDDLGLGDILDAIKTVVVATVADDQGNFTLRNVPTGKLRVNAKGSDGYSGTTSISVDKADQSVVITMTKQPSVRGTVKDERGKPVALATVTIRPLGMSMGNDGGSAVTRSDGTFEISGVKVGEYFVSVSDEHGSLPWVNTRGPSPGPESGQNEGMGAMLQGKQIGVTPSLAPLELVVELPREEISGVVLAADGGLAADAWVTIRRERSIVNDGQRSVTVSIGDNDDDDDDDDDRETPASERDYRSYEPVLTDASGSFKFTKLRSGTYRVTATGEKGTTRGDVVTATGRKVSIQLGRLGTISGVVTFGSVPVSEYKISCTAPGSNISRNIISPTGSYQLERVPVGKQSCSIQADGGIASGSAVVTIDTPAKLDFSLAAWGSVTGTLVDVATDKPVPGVVVFRKGFEGEDIGGLITGGANRSDDKGAFAVAKLGSGEQELNFTTGGMLAMQSLGRKKFTLAQSEKKELGPVLIVGPRAGPPGELGMKVKNGKVVLVSNDGPAAKVGVKLDDMIVAVYGKPSAQIGDVVDAIFEDGSASVGQSVPIQIMRGKTALTLTVVAAPASK